MRRLLRVGPVWLVLASIASVQVGSSVGKSLFDATSPLTVAWLRVAGAGVLLLAIARPRLRGRTRAAWGWLALFATALVAMNVAFYFAISRIPVGMAVTIEFLGPLAVALGLSRRVRDVVWVVLAAGGVALLGLERTSFDVVGVGLALLAGALWACYILLGPIIGEHWRSVDALGLGCVGMSLLLLPVAWAGLVPSLTDPRVLLLGLGVGLLSSVIPYTLELQALRAMPQHLFSILMSLEPAAAAGIALVVLGETLSLPQMGGIACVMLASAGATWFGRRRAARPVPHEA